MARPGHLRRLTPLVFLAAVGCGYAEARLRDLGDIVRLEGRVGYGLEAHANGGELLHAGLGSAREWNAGWTYGRAGRTEVEEHHFPVPLIRTLLVPDSSHLHSMDVGPEGVDGRHECYLIFPGGINPGGLEKTRAHYLDVEVGFLAGVVGVEAGVSLGEAFDFVLGVFRFSDTWGFLDFADDDDPDRRAEKRLWQRVNRHEGPPNP